MKHILKLNECFVQDKIDGRKPFEIRVNDRNFQKGDTVQYIAVDNLKISTHNLKLERMVFEITSVVSGYGLKEGYVVFGEKQINGGTK